MDHILRLVLILAKRVPVLGNQQHRTGLDDWQLNIALISIDPHYAQFIIQPLIYVEKEILNLQLVVQSLLGGGITDCLVDAHYKVLHKKDVRLGDNLAEDGVLDLPVEDVAADLCGLHP